MHSRLRLLHFQSSLTAFAVRNRSGGGGDGWGRVRLKPWTFVADGPQSDIACGGDRAVADALHERKVAMDEKAKSQLEAEEVAKIKEREERDAEAQKALMKARLVAYYRDYNPEKVDNIDQVGQDTLNSS